jgi:hypothetical protein
MLGKQRDRFVSSASQREEAGTTWQPDEPMSQFRTRITLYFPGEPGKCRQFENVREYTLGTEHRIHFISEDGLSISTSLPFFLERESRK